MLEVEAELRKSNGADAGELQRARQAQEEEERQQKRQQERQEKAHSALASAQREQEKASQVLQTNEVALRAGATAVTERDEAMRGLRDRVCYQQAQQATLEVELAATSAREHQDRRVRAVAQFRQAGGVHASCVLGFLCECLTVDGRHAGAVNAALGQQLNSTVIVSDKPAAIALVAHLKEQKVGYQG